MLLECLPTEIFLEIFTFLPLRDIVTAFSGLNSYIDSIIRLIQNTSHELKYNDDNAIKLLQLFHPSIVRLVVINVEMVDFTSLSNLRSLTLKYGTKKQIENIRPEYFPRLEILHIKGLHRTVSDDRETIENFLHVLLSNGFSRLRICTLLNMGFLIINFNDTWEGSSTLRALNLRMENLFDCNQLRSICPQLRRLTDNRFSMDEASIERSFSDVTSELKKLGGTICSARRRVVCEIKMLERLETENRIIIDVNPLTRLVDQKVPLRSNNTTNTPPSNTTSMFTFQARILPQTEPYCQASFLIEIGLPSEYPFKAPVIILLDPIYHPCVSESSQHLSCWGLTYTPKRHLVNIIDHIIQIIDSSPNPLQMVNRECFEEYQHDYQTFYKNALELTLSYGRPRY